MAKGRTMHSSGAGRSGPSHDIVIQVVVESKLPSQRTIDANLWSAFVFGPTIVETLDATSIGVSTCSRLPDLEGKPPVRNSKQTQLFRAMRLGSAKANFVSSRRANSTDMRPTLCKD